MSSKKLIEINAKEEVSRPADFALKNGVPAEQYVSTLFTSANTSYNGSAMKISADDGASTVKTYIDTTVGNIETLLSAI